MTDHEKQVRRLRLGNVIYFRQSLSNPIVVHEIIFDNYKGDIKAIDGGRVTINGEHWYMEDVTIIMNAGIYDNL